MTRWTNRIGDRLLAAIAPKADVSAASCKWYPCGPYPGCIRRCCTGAGCGPCLCP